MKIHRYLVGIVAGVTMAASAQVGLAAVCSDAPDLLQEIQERGVIRIGWINSKPYQFKNEDGELEGVLVNAGTMLAEELPRRRLASSTTSSCNSVAV